MMPIVQMGNMRQEVVAPWGVLELNLRHSSWVQGCPSRMAALGSDSNDIKVVQSTFSLDL